MTATEMKVQRFQSSVIFALDLSHILNANKDDNKSALQRLRATEEISKRLLRCFIDNRAEFGAWADEKVRISDRMVDADRAGGKKVWTQRFLDRHTCLLLTDVQQFILPGSRRIQPGSSMQGLDDSFRSAALSTIEYRLAREGILLGTFTADFTAPTYDVREVIGNLADFRSASFRTYRTFLNHLFKNQRGRDLIRGSTTLDLRNPEDLRDDEFRGLVHFHSFVLIEGFEGSPTSDGDSEDIGEVARSVELAGILNEATWYQTYAPRYCQEIGDKQIGYRADEIYVTDRRTTVVVASRFWHTDSLQLYRHDLLHVIEHHLARVALMTQLSEFFGDDTNLRPLLAEPIRALPLVLAGRDNVTLLHDSLNYGLLVRHGFTRLFADQLREEMQIPESLEVIEKRITDLSKAIRLSAFRIQRPSPKRLNLPWPHRLINHRRSPP